ncbi:MAG: hypothetical protein WAM77_20320 [Xanthobacteraceae bacterium]
MRRSAIAPAFVLAAVIIAAVGIAFPNPAAADPYCPNPAHATPAKVPPDLVSAVAKTFGIDSTVVANGAFVRCVGARLMACAVGANLVCDKADQRRELPGATEWCRDNPRSDTIPMFATGHSTIYEWSCKRRRAVPGKLIVAVDPQGYITENWKEVPTE